MGDRLIEDFTDIANFFNTFFSNIGINLANPLNRSNIQKTSRLTDNDSCSFLSPTGPGEIHSIVKKMINKAARVDNTSTQIIENIINYILLPSSYNHNLCFQTAVWPDELKSAEIVPVLKGREEDNPTNHRPISLIPNRGKILEKILHKRI